MKNYLEPDSPINKKPFAPQLEKSA
jgi:hypothetical protein